MGHRHDGLQAHSVGEDYPYAVVGTIDMEGDTRYYVMNLQTGQRDICLYRYCDNAHFAAHKFALGEWSGEWETAY